MTDLNLNFFSPTNFKFSLKKLPFLEQFVQGVSFPGIDIPYTALANPFADLNTPGNKMNFNSLKCTFKVDEELENYFAIFDWMEGLAHPESLNQYAKLASMPTISGQGAEADGTVFLLDAQSNPIISVKFAGMSPSSLSGFELNTTDSGLQFITADVVFNYTNYTYERLS